MSNISITCKISLSKKLRALIGKQGNILLTSDSLNNGVGEGRLNITSENELNDVSIDNISETSIMLTAIEVMDLMPDSNSLPHSSIFSISDTSNNKTNKTNKNDKNNRSDTVVKKIAVTEALEDHEIKERTSNVKTPDEFREIDDPECRNWISNLNQLMTVVKDTVENKKSNIDINAASTDRERAVLLEQREREEAIGFPAWIVNKRAGGITINDLEISLPLNVPFDLSRISARRILASKDLKSLINSGFVEFITNKNEVTNLLTNTGVDSGDGGLEIYDSHEDAMDSVGTPKQSRPKSNVMIDDAKAVDVSGEEELTEEESMIMDLTQNMPEEGDEESMGRLRSPRTTNHGRSTLSNNSNVKGSIHRKI